MKTLETTLARTMFHLLILAGCVLAFLTPPIQNADEDSHLIRSVMVAEGQVDVRQDGSVLGQDVPKSLIDYVNSHRYLMQQPNARYSYQSWYVDSHAAADGPRQLHGYSGQSLSPLYYLPQSAGIWVGKALYFVAPVQFNWAAAGYFARLGNVLAYALVFYWAIGAAPRFAASLSFLAVTPMPLSLAASASYDVTVLLSAVAFFAAVMRAGDRQGGPTRRDMWLIGALAFMLGHSKGVYLPVMITLVCLLRSMGLLRFAKLSSCCILAALVGAFFSSVLFGLPDQPHLQGAIDGQVRYVMSNWMNMPALVLGSIVHFRDSLFIGMTGNLGWLDTNFTLPFLVLWLGVGILAVINDAGVTPKFRSPLIVSACILGGVALSVFVLFLALYISWTSVTTGVGAGLIDSVQGRYLLPVVPYIMAAAALLCSAVVPKPLFGRSSALRLQITLSMATATVTIAVVLFRYWIPAPA